MSNDANLAYQQIGALSSDPVTLVLMLYDMLLKDLREAASTFPSGSLERRASSVRHALLVLQELQTNLNMEHGGIVARNLSRFYDFIRAKILEAQIKASVDLFEGQISLVSSLRDAWHAVTPAEQLQATEPVPEPLPAFYPAIVDNTFSSAEWRA